MITLAIDAMGGDHGLEATVPAALEIIGCHPDVSLLLAGDPRRIDRCLAACGAQTGERLQVVGASELVEMNESAAAALRKKKNSSMRVAIDLVRDGRAAACISSGNTGALLATARFVLNTISGIDRPAICTALPRMNGQTHVLDLGANLDSPPEILFQFGVMGTVLLNCLEGKTAPTVGLLNIGVEDVKGNDTIKAAAELFKHSALNYVGYIEADDIYAGDTDLVVCDGFAGNVALKATEGAAQMIMGVVKEEFSRSIAARTSGLLAKPVLDSIKKRLDPRRYNGASLLGLKGTVVKSHGGADAVGFRCAVEVGIKEVREGLVRQIEHAMKGALTEPPDSVTLPK